MSAHQAAPKPRHRFLTTAIAFGLLLALSIPAFAGGPHDKATGSVEWAAQGGNIPGLVSEFAVHNDAPGAGGGDRGWYTLDYPGEGTLTLDITCVEIWEDTARFSGRAVEGTGIYANDAASSQGFVVWVEDNATPGRDGDLFGQTRTNSPDTACNGGFVGQGFVTSGNLTVFYGG